MKGLIKYIKLWYYYCTDEQRELVKEVAIITCLLFVLGVFMALMIVGPYFLLR